MHDSSAKRDWILKAAAKLFVKHGFDGTTFATVSKASGAAVGSTVHFFGDKGELAAAVYDRAACRLVNVAKTALHGHKTDVEAAIRELLSVFLKWAEKSPHDRRLIGKLEAYMSTEQIQTVGLQDRLAEVLASWAGKLGPKHVARLSPSQLYAVVLAPAMCVITPATNLPPNDRRSPIDWVQVPTSAAVTGIAPQKIKPSQPLKGGTHAKARRRTSASRKYDARQGGFDY